MQVRSWRHDNEFIVYDGELIQTPTVDLFNAEWWREQDLSHGSFDGRAKVYVVRHGASDWVLRRYRRGGLAARFAESAYVWTGLQRTRPWREWHLLATLHARDLPVPRPVAAHVARKGLRYSGHLLSELIPDVRPLRDALCEQALSRAHWRKLGATLRRFHDAGVHHPDLNVRNILVREGGDFYVLDFDRGHLAGTRRQFRQNLQRLRRSIDKLAARESGCRVESADWDALLDGYRG